jgi:hypothetical protein
MVAGQFAFVLLGLVQIHLELMLTWVSSRQAIKKYIQANNNLTGMTEPAFNKHISRALEVGEGKVFEFPKGQCPHLCVGRRIHGTSSDVQFCVDFTSMRQR